MTLPENELARSTLSSNLRKALELLSWARSDSNATDAFYMSPEIEEKVRAALETAAELRDGAEGWQRWYLERFIKENV